MKHTKKWLSIATGSLLFFACSKNNNNGNNSGNINNDHVYIISNAAKGNKLMDFSRSPNGTLTLDSIYATGGTGTDAGLGSQGAVAIAGDGTIIVVNAGSNSISSFRRSSRGLIWQSTVNSGGTTPVSLTEFNGTVFVLNDGGAGNISGFSLSGNGKLTAIANSTHALVDVNAGPAEVAFINDGSVLVVTEKNSNKITSFSGNGTTHSLTSANTTPFGFAVGANGNIYVSEAAGGASGASTVSSYHVSDDGIITLITGAVSAKQSSACWVTLSGDGKYAFSSNTASNTMSAFSIGYNGSLSVSAAVAATTEGKPADAALSGNAQFLYVLSAGTNAINCFRVGQTGSLTSIQTINNIPASTVGMAAN